MDEEPPRTELDGYDPDRETYLGGPHVPGPIFISHASGDSRAVNELASALRMSLNEEVRLFNTSSGTAISLGSTWRERVLAALKEASLVILWASADALQSREVAFEIGAAFAYEKRVIPCCVHVSPTVLPWSLSERQALLMDQPQAWERLAHSVANIIDYPGAIDLSALSELSEQFETPKHTLDVQAVGRTLILHNIASTAVRDLQFHLADSTKPVPDWTIALTGSIIEADGTVFGVRDNNEDEVSMRISWVDISNSRASQDVAIPAVRNIE